MKEKKDWKKPFAIVLLIVLLGGYYEGLSVEMKTMVLPLAIFIAAGILISRLKKLEYEITTSRLNAREAIVQSLRLIDPKGNERISISTDPKKPLMTFFDSDRIPRATLNVLDNAPVLKLVGNKGSVTIEFDEEGLPHLNLKDDADTILWSAV
jgi:K+-sensing histidine kinase KdpD